MHIISGQEKPGETTSSKTNPSSGCRLGCNYASIYNDLLITILIYFF